MPSSSLSFIGPAKTVSISTMKETQEEELLKLLPDANLDAKQLIEQCVNTGNTSTINSILAEPRRSVTVMLMDLFPKTANKKMYHFS
ncbi:protoporphyrinogen oxidase protein [Anopheles sinensis]|uniref:Protoporphyrinogen oxidase protein n=1 Tax=Anopheles sinensis TaxID=74873 RepID=A0A084W084_ANOSI|nr:protoporphyrinogen oxidase protein [Anopheles sinensis]